MGERVAGSELAGNAPVRGTLSSYIFPFSLNSAIPTRASSSTRGGGRILWHLPKPVVS